LRPERRNFPPDGTYFPVHLPLRPGAPAGSGDRAWPPAPVPGRHQEEKHMKFSNRVIGAAAGTAVLGLAAFAIADAAAGQAGHPQATTLAAVSRTRPSADPAIKRAGAGKQPRAVKQPAAGKQITGAKPARGGKPGAAGSAGPSGPPPRAGRVIPAGFKDPAGELVFYGVRIDLRQLPGTTFGIMAGLRDASGALTPEVETNETTGPDTAPGFHAVQAPSSVGSPAVTIPEFGYYAGPAASITALDHGRVIHARLARWSVNPRIVVFWFIPPAAPAGATLTGLAAYDAAGHQLPAGSTAPGHG
jgi:hypothetical protein